MRKYSVIYEPKITGFFFSLFLCRMPDVRPAFEFAVWVESGSSTIQPFKCGVCFGTKPCTAASPPRPKTIEANLKKISKLSTLNSGCKKRLFSVTMVLPSFNVRSRVPRYTVASSCGRKDKSPFFKTQCHHPHTHLCNSDHSWQVMDY